jgi:hypothetical protein
MSKKNKTGKTTKAAKGTKAPKATSLDAGGGILIDIAPPPAVVKMTGEKKPQKLTGLDAAFEVLKARCEPMTCKTIVDEMLAKGMWTTRGKTPYATINSALAREIETKPGDSRFAKVGPGLFTAVTPKAART